jgi:hypothetical protein
MAGLVAHRLRGHKESVGLKALDYLLGGNSLDSLPVDVACWCQPRCCTHMEMEIENDQFCIEKTERFPISQQTVVASGRLSPSLRSSGKGLLGLRSGLLELECEFDFVIRIFDNISFADGLSDVRAW